MIVGAGGAEVVDMQLDVVSPSAFSASSRTFACRHIGAYKGAATEDVESLWATRCIMHARAGLLNSGLLRLAQERGVQLAGFCDLRECVWGYVEAFALRNTEL